MLKPFALPTVHGLGIAQQAGAGVTTRPCGSLQGPRWYVARVGPSREALARDRIEHLGFATFVPLIAREIRHARQRWIAARPLFPRHLLLRFDAEADAWRRVYQAGLGLKIFGATPERPTPLPHGLAERWIGDGFDRPLTRDLGPDLIAAGAPVELAGGPFTDHRGVCLWDDGRRVRVLLSIMGRLVETETARNRVRRAS